MPPRQQQGVAYQVAKEVLCHAQRIPRPLTDTREQFLAGNPPSLVHAVGKLAGVAGEERVGKLVVVYHVPGHERSRQKRDYHSSGIWLRKGGSRCFPTNLPGHIAVSSPSVIVLSVVFIITTDNKTHFIEYGIMIS